MLMVLLDPHVFLQTNINGTATLIGIVKLIIYEFGKSEDLIIYVTDQNGHDLRYAIDPTNIHNELGWLSEIKFEVGIKKDHQMLLGESVLVVRDHQRRVSELLSEDV